MSDNHKEVLGPPFAGNGWTKIATSVPPEFWSAVRLDANTGDMVLQLGVQPHPSTTQTVTGQLIAGFQRDFTAIADGYYTFTVRWEPKQITIRNHGATVHTDGIFFGSDLAADFVPLTSYTPVTRTYRRYLRKGTHRLVTFGGSVSISYTADQTATAEIIGRAAFLEVEYPPVLAAMTAEPIESADLPSAQFFDDFESRLTRKHVESLEQARKHGLEEFKAHNK